jgi:hypothetical protein
VPAMETSQLARRAILGTLALLILAVWCAIIVAGMLGGGLSPWVVAAWVVITLGAWGAWAKWGPDAPEVNDGSI